MTGSPDDGALDAALRGLPCWKPPTGLGSRLAAAASRQHEALARRRPPSTGARLLALANRLLPWAVGPGLAAAVLAELPWATLVQHPAESGLAISAAIAAAGLRRVWRLLRS